MQMVFKVMQPYSSQTGKLVVANGYASTNPINWAPVTSSLPQGSILGPEL